MITQEQFRSNFDVAGKRLFFNHAAYSPISRPVVNAINEFFEHRQMGNPLAWNIAVDHMEGLRSNYGKLVGAPAERIAHMANTVSGVNVLANGLDWKAGDHILLYVDEFPSNVMPFLNLKDRGVEVEFISAGDGRVTPELFEAALKPQTRLISISSVQYLTGFRADLKNLSELCHSRNIIFSVDAIQSVGVVPTDVIASGVDFMAVGGHKWMMSPLGTGFLYVTEELQSRLKLVHRGYMGHVNPIDFGNFDQELSPNAQRFELGAFNASGMVGAEKATELLLECGIDSIFRHVRKLIGQFEWGLDELPFKTMYQFEENEQSSICMFSHNDASRNEAIFQSLSASGVNISLRGGGLRLAPHYYNTSDEVDQILALLKGSS
ncbi:MAG: aminotransferase class V-fold PLP-dependent enzyme [Candidatus Marinimicrobia bacterium]|jgi:selenocysteine lyase/cysteine desulfurase|nr:aminotransferase class V-fold PLP-dependent enzyme [Candidatus Neomarinimicrobiota bacterium]MBT3576101.1 aminotransferase class V-fold PLP-dependent enzyme [Candidatus Neomarinimicrobiota bacterium]MBT3680626.1 aminotransferase class V-fold PLP-dependent enzyme [Candidatus Neomarinimicrobiota bacterium]MBT3951633.1 aminotransferase class V-fold PLP-dependent enzyme [Candidatus Neomarinimicrobiota bacterium]MBT4251758.1 aminotransferase class V-fold PLP-dependent enzyme [Candidatus Neomarini